MPHQALKLIAGVDQNKTPTLNEAAISYSNLIRFIPDRNNIGLVQKLGGWTQFFTNPIGSVVRCLLAWEDINANAWLGVGAEASLNVIANGGLKTITPQKTTVNIAVSFTTTTGATGNVVTINATGSGLDQFDTVDIQTQVSVGGLVLFGAYQVVPVSTNQFQILATDILGNPQYATSAVTGGGSVPSFATLSGTPNVTVTLANHGLSVDSTFPVLVSTTVGGITLLGNYIVTSVTSSSVFTIVASNSASSSTTGSENGGSVRMIYYNGIGALLKNSGYGVGGYGVGGYGSGIPPSAGTGTPITTTDWTLENWGETLIACPLNGPIYEWSPTTSNPVATIIPAAPLVNQGMFVAMPQRQVVAWGSTFNGIEDPLLVRWCDVNDYTSWIALITNQAGSYRIPKGSRIVQGIQGAQQGLLWTDLGVWAMQYVGQPYIYQFNELGTGCGLIGRKAAGSMGGVVYWMGQSQFYMLSGNGVEPIMCPVWDVIFQDLDTNNLDKIRIAPNSRFNEVSWFYPTKGNGGEINAYVKYNVGLKQWDYGELSRTAWINESVLGPPIGAGVLPGGTGNFIVQHETSTNGVNASNEADPIMASFQTGYFALTEADVKMFIDQVWPDMKWGYFGGSQNATVELTFYAADYPGSTPYTYGPYSLTQGTEFITPRFRGRLVSIKVESQDLGSFWRIGNMRYRIQQDGKY
jgi:hypothetical protein